MTIQTLFALMIIYLAVCGAVLHLIVHASPGYEDERGFHKGPEPVRLEAPDAEDTAQLLAVRVSISEEPDPELSSEGSEFAESMDLRSSRE